MEFMALLESKLKELGAYVFQMGDLKKGLLAANGPLQCSLMFSGANLALRNPRPLVTIMVYAHNTQREQAFLDTVMGLIDGLQYVCIVESTVRGESHDKYLVMAITVRYGG